MYFQFCFNSYTECFSSVNSFCLNSKRLVLLDLRTLENCILEKLDSVSRFKFKNISSFVFLEFDENQFRFKSNYWTAFGATRIAAKLLKRKFLEMKFFLKFEIATSDQDKI